MKQKTHLPLICPSCNSALSVKTLICEACETTVSGCYKLPTIMHLHVEEQDFILNFVKSSGSLKEMAKQMNLSYPTVRNYLDALIDKINEYQKTNE